MSIPTRIFRSAYYTLPHMLSSWCTHARVAPLQITRWIPFNWLTATYYSIEAHHPDKIINKQHNLKQLWCVHCTEIFCPRLFVLANEFFSLFFYCTQIRDKNSSNLQWQIKFITHFFIWWNDNKCWANINYQFVHFWFSLESFICFVLTVTTIYFSL